MKQLKFEDAKGMRWVDIVRHYFPNATDEECDYILWEETCFPFDTDRALEQLFELATEQKTI